MFKMCSQTGSVRLSFSYGKRVYPWARMDTGLAGPFLFVIHS